MKQVGIFEAKTHLSSLLDEVEKGGEVTITRHGKPVARLVQALRPDTGKAVRVGITGSPGVGKSTTIDVLGTMLIERGHKVAVLAVDSSSTRTAGSILGDRTRMARLSNDSHEFGAKGRKS